jgi:hypothetical protein
MDLSSFRIRVLEEELLGVRNGQEHFQIGRLKEELRIRRLDRSTSK